MNDSQLLRDIEDFKNHIEETFNKLLYQSKQLHQEAQNKETTIRDLISEHQKYLEQVNASVELIGGSNGLKTFLDKIQKTHQLLSQYSNINHQVNHDLIKYQDLKNQSQQQLNQCSIARDSLREAYDNIEDLQSFCNELLDIRQFLQGVSGFSKLYISIQEVTQLISDFKQQEQDLEARWTTVYNQGTNLLTQLQQSQESGHDLVTRYHDLSQQVMRLEQACSRLNHLNKQVNIINSKLAQLEQNYQQDTTENQGSQQQLTREIKNLKKIILWCLLGGIVGSFINNSVFLSWILPTFQNQISQPSQSLIKTN